jgi:hypothetical protein
VTALPAQSRALIQAAALLGTLDLPCPVSVAVHSSGGIDLQVLERGTEAERWAAFDYLAEAFGGEVFTSTLGWPTLVSELAGHPVHMYAPMLAPRLAVAS